MYELFKISIIHLLVSSGRVISPMLNLSSIGSRCFVRVSFLAVSFLAVFSFWVCFHSLCLSQDIHKAVVVESSLIFLLGFTLPAFDIITDHEPIIYQIFKIVQCRKLVILHYVYLFSYISRNIHKFKSCDSLLCVMEPLSL